MLQLNKPGLKLGERVKFAKEIEEYYILSS